MGASMVRAWCLGAGLVGVSSWSGRVWAGRVGRPDGQPQSGRVWSFWARLASKNDQNRAQRTNRAQRSRRRPAAGGRCSGALGPRPPGRRPPPAGVPAPRAPRWPGRHSGPAGAPAPGPPPARPAPAPSRCSGAPLPPARRRPPQASNGLPAGPVRRPPPCDPRGLQAGTRTPTPTWLGTSSRPRRPSSTRRPVGSSCPWT